MATLHLGSAGLELAAHCTFSIATGVQVYFCDPYESVAARDRYANTNGLLRLVLARRGLSYLACYTQVDLNKCGTRPQHAAFGQDTRLSHDRWKYLAEALLH